MKIYAARQSLLNTLKYFAGQDIWILFDRKQFSHFDYGVYMQILATNYDIITYRIAMDTPTFDALEYAIPQDVYDKISNFTEHQIRALPKDKFMREYKLHQPLGIYTTDELHELIENTEVYEQ